MPLQAAWAPPKRRERAPHPNGSRAQVELASGNVSAEAALVANDARSGVASYAVRIANSSPIALRAQVRCSRRGAVAMSELLVAPFSLVETLVPISTAHLCSPERAIIEISGANIAFAIDAPAPLATSRRAMQHAASWLLAMLFPAVLAAGAIVTFTGTLAVPHGAGQGALTRVAERAIPGGFVPLHPHRVAHAADSVPLLDDLAVAPLPAYAGKSVRVTYTTAASTGDVWLLDQSGRTWAHAPLNNAGITTLAIPQSAAGRDMRVVVHAQRGTAHMQSAVGIVVLPDEQNIATNPSEPAQTPAIAVTPSRVASGAAITIAFPAGHGEALVSLTDQSGSIAEQIDVPAGERGVTLRAPAVGAATTYDVVIDSSRGVSRESLIRPVIVVP